MRIQLDEWPLKVSLEPLLLTELLPFVTFHLSEFDYVKNHVDIK